MTKIQIDVSNPQFKADLQNLEKQRRSALISQLEKISQLTWEQLYKDQGIKWEQIHSKKTTSGKKIYSFRYSQKYRAVALRDGNFLKLLYLPKDHDSTYH